MSFCSKCGKQHKKGESFCSQCGTALKEVKDVIEKTIKVVERKSSKGFVVFIILLIVVGYVALDIWAVSQLKPVFTFDSVLTSISNFEGDISLTKTTASTTLRFENPTFVPILFSRVAYDSNYGNTKIAEGKTGFFIMAPYSEKDIPVDLTIYNVNTLWAGGKWIWNKITGQSERKYTNVYADIGITKFKIATLE